MRLRHKAPMEAVAPKPEPISDRYQVEVDASVRRAERAWRRAERRAQRAKEVSEAQPTTVNRAAYESVLAEAERLRAEFEELDRLMRQAPVSSSHSGAGQVRHRTGRDDHLEQGVHKPRRGGRSKRSFPVESRRTRRS